MAQNKKTARRSPKDLKPRIRPEDRAIHILMPYILGLLALFFGLCFILGEEKLGFLGKISVASRPSNSKMILLKPFQTVSCITKSPSLYIVGVL